MNHRKQIIALGCAVVALPLAGLTGAALGSALLGALLGAALSAVIWRHRSEQQATAQLALVDAHLAHTAHELRTPLAAIATAIELVQQGYANTPEEVDECLEQARLAARHLGFLVDDVLDAAAAHAGQLQLDCQEHEVAELFAAARGVLGLQARHRGQELQFTTPDGALRVYTDERRCLQLLFNLVGNALKFNGPDEAVTVQASRHGDMVRFLVIDRGPGVPAELRDRLFQPFAAAAIANARGAPSTGLGLHVCKLLASQLAGRLGYEPGQGRGSVFWFELPAARSTRTTAGERLAANTAVAASAPADA